MIERGESPRPGRRLSPRGIETVSCLPPEGRAGSRAESPVRCAEGVAAIRRRDQVPHELSRHLGLLMGVADINRLAIHYGQIVTQLVAHVALISNDLHGADKIAVVLVRIAP